MESWDFVRKKFGRRRKMQPGGKSDQKKSNLGGGGMGEGANGILAREMTTFGKK